MKRYLLCLLALCLLCGLLCACGEEPGEAKPALPDGETLAAELLASGAFSDTLEPADVKIGCYLYGLAESDAQSMHFRLSSGATAEEIAVFRCADEASAQRVEAAAKARLDYQRESFGDYVPEELPKLEKAVLRREGSCVLLCVAADYAAVSAVLDAYDWTAGA